MPAPEPTPGSAGTATPSSVAGWDALIENLRTLPDRMLAKLPSEKRADPQFQQEAGRLALEAIASAAIDAIGGDGDFPVFLPTIGHLLNIGQPNADTIYRSARLCPGGTYRLRGRPGSLNQVRLSQIVPNRSAARPHIDIHTLHLDASGFYDLLLSEQRPDNYDCDWWGLSPATDRLMVRLVSSDWANEESPTFSLERLDRPMGRLRSPAADLEQRLQAMPRMLDIGMLFVDHVEQLRQEGYVHKFKEFDVSKIGGLVGQFYYESVYELQDDEALIIESAVPQTCPYRSIILTNEIYETTDWINNHSSLNGSQSAPDSDGILRFVVSPRDPGVRNWLDTAGNPTGIIQGRWTDCDSQPIPTIHKVALAEIANHLPADTLMVSPEERDLIVRARRMAFVQRPQW